MSHRFIVGDASEVLRALPAASVQCVVTSPPFIGLRNYTDDDREIGKEGSPGEFIGRLPGEFIGRLLDVVAEVGRVLALDGSLCVELGDTFADSGGAGGDYLPGGMREGQPVWRQGRDSGDRRTVGGDKRPGGHHNGGLGWPPGKSMCLIPHLFAASLAYGRNLLTGEDSPAGEWRVRNVVCWARRNPSPGRTADKLRVGTSYITIACRQRSRYFDHEPIAVPKAESPGNTYVRRVSDTDALRRPEGGWDVSTDNRITADHDPTETDTVPPLDWMIEPGEDTWAINAKRDSPSPIAAGPTTHFATWPEEVARRLILAMCPPGETVLDPFAGTGTTLAAAQGVGRSSIGIDLDPRCADLAREKVGMFLQAQALAYTIDPPGHGWVDLA